MKIIMFLPNNVGRELFHSQVDTFKKDIYLCVIYSSNLKNSGQFKNY